MTRSFVKRHWPTINLAVGGAALIGIGYIILNFDSVTQNPAALPANALKGGIVWALLRILTMAHKTLNEVYEK